MRELLYCVVGYTVVIAILLILKHYDLLPSTNFHQDLVDRMYPEYEKCIRKMNLYESLGKELDVDCYEKIEIFEDYMNAFYGSEYEYVKESY